jgi:hypothetical protein
MPGWQISGMPPRMKADEVRVRRRVIGVRDDAGLPVALHENGRLAIDRDAPALSRIL